MSNNKKPFYKKWWFIAIIVLLVAGTVYGAATGDLKNINETSAPIKPKAHTSKIGTGAVTDSPTPTGISPTADYAAAIQKTLDESFPEGTEPEWVYSIQEIINDGTTGVNVRYQLPDMTDGEAKAVARRVMLQASGAGILADLQSVTVIDTNGVEHYVPKKDIDVTSGVGENSGRIN